MDENKNNLPGDTTYGNNVLRSIIRLAAQEISGVETVTGKGVRCSVNGKTVTVDVFLEVDSEVKCSDIAYRVQDNIKKSVETMTDYNVGYVNVNIISVKFAKRA